MTDSIQYDLDGNLLNAVQDQNGRFTTGDAQERPAATRRDEDDARESMASVAYHSDHSAAPDAGAAVDPEGAQTPDEITAADNPMFSPTDVTTFADSNTLTDNVTFNKSALQALFVAGTNTDLANVTFSAMLDATSAASTFITGFSSTPPRVGFSYTRQATDHMGTLTITATDNKGTLDIEDDATAVVTLDFTIVGSTVLAVSTATDAAVLGNKLDNLEEGGEIVLTREILEAFFTTANALDAQSMTFTVTTNLGTVTDAGSTTRVPGTTDDFSILISDDASGITDGMITIIGSVLVGSESVMATRVISSISVSAMNVAPVGTAPTPAIALDVGDTNSVIFGEYFMDDSTADADLTYSIGTITRMDGATTAVTAADLGLATPPSPTAVAFGVATGTYNVSVTATDERGAISNPIIVPFTITNAAPAAIANPTLPMSIADEFDDVITDSAGNVGTITISYADLRALFMGDEAPADAHRDLVITATSDNAAVSFAPGANGSLTLTYVRVPFTNTDIMLTFMANDGANPAASVMLPAVLLAGVAFDDYDFTAAAGFDTKIGANADEGGETLTTDNTQKTAFYLRKGSDLGTFSTEAALEDVAIIRVSVTGGVVTFDDVVSGSTEVYYNFTKGTDRIVFLVTQIDDVDTTTLTAAQITTYLNSLSFASLDYTPSMPGVEADTLGDDINRAGLKITDASGRAIELPDFFDMQNGDVSTLSGGTDAADQAAIATFFGGAANFAFIGNDQIALNNTPATYNNVDGLGKTIRQGTPIVTNSVLILDAEGVAQAQTDNSFTYAWYRTTNDDSSFIVADPTRIAGETGATYTPTNTDVAHFIYVVISFEDDIGTQEVLAVRTDSKIANREDESPQPVEPTGNLRASMRTIYTDNRSAPIEDHVELLDDDGVVIALGDVGGAGAQFTLSAEDFFSHPDDTPLIETLTGKDYYIGIALASSYRVFSVDGNNRDAGRSLQGPGGSPLLTDFSLLTETVSADRSSVTYERTANLEDGAYILSVEFVGLNANPSNPTVLDANTTPKTALVYFTVGDNNTAPAAADGVSLTARGRFGDTNFATSLIASTFTDADGDDLDYTITGFTGTDEMSVALTETANRAMLEYRLPDTLAAAAADFTLNTETGALAFSAPAASAGTNNYIFTVQATDGIDTFEHDITIEFVADTPATGTVVIRQQPIADGLAVDSVLRADTRGVSDIDGIVSFTYQWQRDGTDIADATGETYTLVAADTSAAITVNVTSTDAIGGTTVLPAGMVEANTVPVANTGFTADDVVFVFDVASNQFAVGSRVYSVPDPIDISGGITDADGDSLIYTLTSVTNSTSETVNSGIALDAAGMLSVTDSNLAPGAYSIMFTATDNMSDPARTTTSMLMVTFNRSPHLSQALPSATDHPANRVFEIDLDDYFSDADGIASFGTPVFGGSGGAVVINSVTNILTLTPTAGENLTDGTITVTARDPSGAETVAQIDFTATDANPAPEALTSAEIAALNNSDVNTFIEAIATLDDSETVTVSAATLGMLFRGIADTNDTMSFSITTTGTGTLSIAGDMTAGYTITATGTVGNSGMLTITASDGLANNNEDATSNVDYFFNEPPTFNAGDMGETSFEFMISAKFADINITNLFADTRGGMLSYTLVSVTIDDVAQTINIVNNEQAFGGITFNLAMLTFSTESSGAERGVYKFVISASDGIDTSRDAIGEIAIMIFSENLPMVSDGAGVDATDGAITLDATLASQGKFGSFVYTDQEASDDIRFYIARGGALASGEADAREFVLIDANGFTFEGEWGTLSLGEPTTNGTLTWSYLAKAQAHTAARSESFTIRTSDERAIDHNDDATYAAEQYITIALAMSESAILTNTPEGTEIVVPLVPTASDTDASPEGYKITKNDMADASQVIVADQAPDVIEASAHGDRIDAGRGIDEINLAAAADTVYYTIGASNGPWVAYDGADTINNFERGVDKLALALRVPNVIATSPVHNADAETRETYYVNNAVRSGVDLRPIYDADGTMVAGIELVFDVSGSSYGGISTGNVLTVNFAAPLATADYAALDGLSAILGGTAESADVFDVNFEGVAENNAAEVARGSELIDAIAVARVGVDISVNVNQISDADGLSNALADVANNFSYQWVRLDSVGLGADIASFALINETETGATYTPDAANIGDFIRVIVSFRDDAGNAESVSSDAVRIIPAAAVAAPGGALGESYYDDSAPALDADAPPPLDIL